VPESGRFVRVSLRSRLASSGFSRASTSAAQAQDPFVQVAQQRARTRPTSTEAQAFPKSGNTFPSSATAPRVSAILSRDGIRGAAKTRSGPPGPPALVVIQVVALRSRERNAAHSPGRTLPSLAQEGCTGSRACRTLEIFTDRAAGRRIDVGRAAQYHFRRSAIRRSRPTHFPPSRSG